MDCFVAALLAMTFKRGSSRRGRLPRKYTEGEWIASSLRFSQ
jgi:hypothetical protein